MVSGKKDDNAKAHLPLTRVDGDEYIQECLHAIINGAETVLKSACACKPHRNLIYNIIASSRNQRGTSIETDIFRALNTSVSADREQTEDLLISDHIVTTR